MIIQMIKEEDLMKRKTSKLLALMLAALLAAAFITPVLADPSPSHELSEHEQELLLAFCA